MDCPYCNQPAKLVTGEVIYPHRRDLWSKKFWACSPCDAYVGCYPGGDRPLGRLADAELRVAKRQAHAAFDPIWQQGRMSRSAAYVWLSKTLGVPEPKCHIGMFDVDLCRRVVKVCREMH